ncbi:MAG: NADP-binding protein [Pseudomonadota bacterium]
MREVKVIQYGVGAMGSLMVRTALKRKGLRFVGAIDQGEKVGMDLGEAIGLDSKLDITISGDPKTLFKNTDADIILHATESFLDNVYPQIAIAIEAGMNVISICEELAYPWYQFPELASKIDRLARENSVTVVGTGVNPGFTMDTLVMHYTGLCAEVKRITAKRISDSSLYGPKVLDRRGIGLSLDEWQKKRSENKITGHIGHHEAMRMVAASLGWSLDKTGERQIEPIIAEVDIEFPYGKIEKGAVCGYNQKAYGLMAGEEVMLFESEGRIYGENEEQVTEDSVYIEGNPEIRFAIKPGLAGDVTTSSMAVNTIASVMDSRPGLVSVRDLPNAAALIDIRKFHQY